MTSSKQHRTVRFAVVVGVLALAGGVWAATAAGLFRVDVDTTGKTEPQVEAEIRQQLTEQGVQTPQVKFERVQDGQNVSVDGRMGDKVIRIERRILGGGQEGVTLEPPALDTAREPGMTDEELVAKIQAQIEALGLGGTATVDGDDVQVRIERRVEVGEDDAPE